MSLCAASALWGSGRLEVLVACGSDPDLSRRGEADGVGDLLKTLPGRVVNVEAFLKWVFGRLEGVEVVRSVSSLYPLSLWLSIPPA